MRSGIEKRSVIAATALATPAAGRHRAKPPPVRQIGKLSAFRRIRSPAREVVSLRAEAFSSTTSRDVALSASIPRCRAQ
jgi:hypothetical protein